MENKEKEALLEIILMTLLTTIAFNIAISYSTFVAGILLLLGLVIIMNQRNYYTFIKNNFNKIYKS